MAPTMNTSSLDYRQCFRIDPNTPVDALLKRGIFRTFELLQKRYPSKAHQIRLAVVNALNILSQVDANIQGQHIRTNTEKPAFGVTFFSSIHDRLIEFVPSKDVGKFKAQGHSIDKLPAANSKSSKGQQANVAFKSVLLKVLDLCPIDSVERVLFEGVFFILQMSEDFAGPVIQVFRQQQPLFVKLREVYEQSSLSSLDSSRGDYNDALAVDASATSEDGGHGGVVLKRDEEVSFGEG